LSICYGRRGDELKGIAKIESFGLFDPDWARPAQAMLSVVAQENFSVRNILQ
jgi:hypothetical protein